MPALIYVAPSQNVVIYYEDISEINQDSLAKWVFTQAFTDLAEKVSKEDIEKWKIRDPFKRLSQSMINSKIWNKEDENELIEKLDGQIQIAWEKAMNDPYPSKDSISKYVYSNN